MSIPKEPRQLMINIMYLVLTALLALNVSAEVLKAFDRVDDGIKASNEVVDNSNAFTEAQLVKAAKKEAKYASLVANAQKARQYSQEFSTYIDTVRETIIRESGGWLDKDGKHYKLKGGKNFEVTTNMFVDNNAGYELQDKIIEYRDKFLELVDPEKRAQVAAAMTMGHSIEHFEPHNAKSKEWDWVHENFDHVPVQATLPALTTFQANAKNAEAAVLGFLQDQLGLEDYKFDNLSAKVLAETKYVVSGKKYKASVFLAATSSQTKPEVYIGTLDPSIKANEDGSFDVIEGVTADKMPLTNPVAVEVDAEGMANYEVVANGARKVYGVIKVPKPNTDNLYDFYPFVMEYETFNPGNVVISPTAMNVLYIGVDNPVEVTAGNANPSTVSVSGAGMKKAQGQGKYIARPSKPGKEVVKVSGRTNDGDPVSGQMEFRIMRIPDPYAEVGGRKGGTIKKNVLAAQTGMIARNTDFVFDLRYKIKGFEMIYAPKRGNIFSATANNNKFNSEMLSVFRSKAKPGDTIIFNNIRVGMPDGTNRTLSLSFKVI